MKIADLDVNTKKTAAERHGQWKHSKRKFLYNFDGSSRCPILFDPGSESPTDQATNSDRGTSPRVILTSEQAGRQQSKAKLGPRFGKTLHQMLDRKIFALRIVKRLCLELNEFLWIPTISYPSGVFEVIQWIKASDFKWKRWLDVTDPIPTWRNQQQVGGGG